MSFFDFPNKQEPSARNGATMLAITGKFATAMCYATQIEDAAIEQVRTLCDQEFAFGSHIAIMPDAPAPRTRTSVSCVITAISPESCMKNLLSAFLL